MTGTAETRTSDDIRKPDTGRIWQLLRSDSIEHCVVQSIIIARRKKANNSQKDAVERKEVSDGQSK